jgi:hypothetical protein
MITAMLLKEFLVGNKEESKGTKYSAAFFSILCLILAVGFILIPAILNKIHSGLPDGFADIPIKIGKWPIILAMLFFASGILSAIAFLKDMRSLLIGLIGLTSSIFLLIAFNLAMPDIERLIQSPLKNFATAIREKNEPERRIASYRINNPSILFYSQQRVLTLHKDNIEELKAMAGEGTPLYVITKLPYARELKEATGMHYAGQDSIYVLLANNMAQCMLDKK